MILTNWEERVCDYFIKNDIIPEENRELYEYGLTQGFVILVNLLVTLLLGCLFHSVWQSLVFTAIYVPLRSYAGGYHAKTQARCYIISICLIIAVLLAIKLLVPNLIIFIILPCIIGTILYLFSPIENENKPLLQEEKVKYKRYTIIIYLVDICILTLSYILGFELFARSILFSLIAVGSMMVIELVRVKM